MTVCFIRNGRAACGLSFAQVFACTVDREQVTCPDCIADFIPQGMEDALKLEERASFTQVFHCDDGTTLLITSTIIYEES